ncbi:MAG: DUF1571 domain-containing protein [Planctomycetota bacterium]
MRYRRRGGLSLTRLASGLAVLLVSGCGAPPIDRPSAVSVEGDQEVMQRIKQDPVEFLEEALAKARELKQFRAEFHRQERLGLLGVLHPRERMTAEYRAEPLSIRFTWLDKDSEYQQAAYVAGQYADKVLLLARVGLLGLPPAVEKFPPAWAALFGKAKFPITDFGPKRLMEKTLARIEAAKACGKVKITLKDPRLIGPLKEPCFHLELRYPPGDKFVTKLQDLYIHTETRLPVATFLWLPGKDERSSATLDAMYQYVGLDPNVKLTGSEFIIDADKQKPAKQPQREAGKTASAAKGEP